MSDIIQSKNSSNDLLEKGNKSVALLNDLLQTAKTDDDYNYIIANIEKNISAINRLLKEGKLSVDDATSLEKSFSDIKGRLELKMNSSDRVEERLSFITYKHALINIYELAKDNNDANYLMEFKNKIINITKQLSDDNTLSSHTKDELSDLAYNIKIWLDKRIDALDRYNSIHF